MIGQDAVTTAQAFHDGVGFTASCSPSSTATPAVARRCPSPGSPAGRSCSRRTGEKLDEFELFHPDRMASRILDMGDVLTLIEQAEKAFDEEQAEGMAAKFAAGEDFTFDDFLAQMQQPEEDGLDEEDARDAAGHGASCASSSRTSTSARSTASRRSSSR